MISIAILLLPSYHGAILPSYHCHPAIVPLPPCHRTTATLPSYHGATLPSYHCYPAIVPLPPCHRTTVLPCHLPVLIMFGLRRASFGFVLGFQKSPSWSVTCLKSKKSNSNHIRSKNPTLEAGTKAVFPGPYGKGYPRTP